MRPQDLEELLQLFNANGKYDFRELMKEVRLGLIERLSSIGQRTGIGSKQAGVDHLSRGVAEQLDPSPAMRTFTEFVEGAGSLAALATENPTGLRGQRYSHISDDLGLDAGGLTTTLTADRLATDRRSVRRQAPHDDEALAEQAAKLRSARLVSGLLEVDPDSPAGNLRAKMPKEVLAMPLGVHRDRAMAKGQAETEKVRIEGK